MGIKLKIEGKETEQEQEIKLHLVDGIKSCREKDFEQAEHNFFEIADHLGIKITADEI